MMHGLTVWCCVTVLALATRADAQLWVDLGPEDTESGLRVSSQPDGRNLPAEFAGRACRRTDVENGSPFLYVHVDDDHAPSDVMFVTIVFFDQDGVVSLNYDAGEGISAYMTAPEAYPQASSGQWRTEIFTLLHPEFRNRQNGGADFRVHADGPLAVARIALSGEPPEGFTPPVNPSAYYAERPPVTLAPGIEIIQQWQVHEPVPAGQLADSAYGISRRIGITSLQSYVGWAQLEPNEGALDYSVYDPVVDQIRKHDLKWLPFLITAPLVATPEWWREGHGVDSVCLEHGTATPIQSIWNPDLRDGVRRFLEVFAAHYEPEVIEALNLGISGNWGESIVVAGGGFGMGDNHTHLGWWCGDPHARAHFQAWARARYETVAVLNAAWGTAHDSWDDITPFIPAQAPSRRAAVDLFAWYSESMTDYAEFWVKTSRELYPGLPIYLCTGGNGQPELAADFAAQARMCAKHGAGIRITNQSDDAPGNFAVTRMVSSSSRLYGGYYTTEPGGANTTKGIAARVFDGVSGGARGLYFKTLVNPPDKPSPNAVVFAENAGLMVPNTPALTVAALMPNSSLAIRRETIDIFIHRTQVLRDALDYEFIDESMIVDGLLGRFRALVVLAGDTVEQPVLDAIGAWVEAGGVLMVPQELASPRNVEDLPASWWPADAVPGAEERVITSHGDGHIVVLPGEFPAWREGMSELLLAADGVPWEAPLSEPLDGAYDGILATRAGDRVYYYNNADQPVDREIPGKGTMTVPPRGILALDMPK